jgi:outer membrane protein TolC
MAPVPLIPRRPATIALALALVAAACAPTPGAAAGSRAARGTLVARAQAAAPVVPAAPRGRCIDDEGSDPRTVPPSRSVPGNTPAAQAPVAADARAPRMNLLKMVQDAIRRSNAVGAARLLAEAAQDDIDETRAGYLPSINATGQVGGVDAGAPRTASTHGSQYQAGVTASGPIWDGGRISDLAGWRTHLAEAARLGEIGAQEQVALQTVSLALDRSRYAVEAQVYDQYANKMACLVDALQDIVAADRGRTSELVQARKTQQQAELMRDQTLSQKRVVEVRLRRFVGDELPPTDGITAVMLDIPDLQDLITIASRAPEIAAQAEQADALDSYVKAVLDGRKPQIGWLLAATHTGGVAPSRSMSGGVTLSVPLFDPAISHTAAAARKRALAAHLQRDDALEERKYRMTEVHEQAEHSLDRARHVVDILHNSELVRNYTLQQWQQLGKRSLFDVMGAEADHYTMRVQYVDALYDTQQSNALLWSLGLGLAVHLQ